MKEEGGERQAGAAQDDVRRHRAAAERTALSQRSAGGERSARHQQGPAAGRVRGCGHDGSFFEDGGADRC